MGPRAGLEVFPEQLSCLCQEFNQVPRTSSPYSLHRLSYPGCQQAVKLCENVKWIRLDVGAATSDDSHTLVKLTVVMATQIWRARAERPALCLHNDTSIGREWIRQPVMAIVSLKGAIRSGGLAVGRQLINTSQAQILFALKTADNVTGERSGKLFTGTGVVTMFGVLRGFSWFFAD